MLNIYANSTLKVYSASSYNDDGSPKYALVYEGVPAIFEVKKKFVDDKTNTSYKLAEAEVDGDYENIVEGSLVFSSLDSLTYIVDLVVPNSSLVGIENISLGLRELANSEVLNLPTE